MSWTTLRMARLPDLQQGWIVRGDDRLADGLDSLLEQLLVTAVAWKKPAQGVGPRPLQFLQGGPALEQIADQGGATSGEPLQHLRKDLLQRGGEAVGVAGFVVHQPAAFLDQELQQAGLDRIGLQGPQPIAVLHEQLQQQVGVSGVALSAGRVKALAVVGQGAGVDWEQHHEI